MRKRDVPAHMKNDRKIALASLPTLDRTLYSRHEKFQEKAGIQNSCIFLPFHDVLGFFDKISCFLLKVILMSGIGILTKAHNIHSTDDATR